MEMLVEQGLVISAPVFEEFVALESEHRPAGCEGAATASHIPHREHSDGIDAETPRKSVHQTANGIIGLRHPLQRAIARRQAVDEIGFEPGAMRIGSSL